MPIITDFRAPTQSYHTRDARRNPPPKLLETVRSARLTQRRQWVEMLTAEKNRVARAPGAIRADIQAHITWLEQRLADLDTDIGRAIRASPLWREHDDLLQSTPGVGPVLSRTLLDDLPEQGIVSRQQMAASVGVAPLNRDSGTLWGKRTVWGGRVIVRGVLYMGNLIAVHLILCSKPSISGCTP